MASDTKTPDSRGKCQPRSNDAFTIYITIINNLSTGKGSLGFQKLLSYHKQTSSISLFSFRKVLWGCAFSTLFTSKCAHRYKMLHTYANHFNPDCCIMLHLFMPRCLIAFRLQDSMVTPGTPPPASFQLVEPERCPRTFSFKDIKSLPGPSETYSGTAPQTADESESKPSAKSEEWRTFTSALAVLSGTTTETSTSSVSWLVDKIPARPARPTVHEITILARTFIYDHLWFMTVFLAVTCTIRRVLSEGIRGTVLMDGNCWYLCPMRHLPPFVGVCGATLLRWPCKVLKKLDWIN